MQNLFDASLTFAVELSNGEAFSATKRVLQVKTGEEAAGVVVYRPTKVGDEFCTVNIAGRDLQGVVRQQSRFKLVGRGTLQVETPVIKVFAQLNQGNAGQIQFKNPFLTKAKVKFEYDKTPEFVFQIKDDQIIEPGQVIMIKYVFIPKRLAVIQTTLKISVDPNYEVESQPFPFEYLFEGVGEYSHQNALCHLECQCRQEVQKTITLPEEIIIESQDDIEFEIECNIPAVNKFEDTAASVRKSLQIAWINVVEHQNALTGLKKPLQILGSKSSKN